MSLSVTRRKSRRKIQHYTNSLSEILLTLGSSSSLYQRNEEENERRGNADDGRKHETTSSSSSDDYTESVSRSERRKFWRKSFPEEYLDLETISLRLGPVQYEMDDLGNWTASGDVLEGGAICDTTIKLAEKNREIARENNLLRVKNELLVDMVARKTVRKDELEKELLRLRRLLSSSSTRFSTENDDDVK